MTLLLGFAFGYIGSIPLAGPIALLVFALGMSDRSRSALFVAIGGALAESLYAYAAFWGLHHLLERYPGLIPESRGVGAVVLLALGLTFVLHKESDKPPAERKAGRGGAFVLGFTITALNPTLIVTWTAAATTLYSTGLVKPETVGSGLPLAAGAFFGIVGWFATLLALLRKFKGHIRKESIARVVRVVGVALIGLSLWFAAGFVRYVFSRGA